MNGGANLSEHVFQGEVIQQQFARVHQPLVFGALQSQRSHNYNDTVGGGWGIAPISDINMGSAPPS